ncbi:MAG: chemotaxis protein CheW [gamma proteobacterium symbiont of Phacoides pectinatus]
MPEHSPADIVRLLRDIETRSLLNAHGMPSEKEEVPLWEGVVFMVAGMRVIAPLNEVREILNYPSAVTVVPGTKPWVLGIANVRGNLLPILDLEVFLGGRGKKGFGRRSRVLVIEHNGIFAGLQISDVQGMRHFSEEQKTEVPVLHEGIRPYVEEAFVLDTEALPVLSFSAMTDDPEFQVAAA